MEKFILHTAMEKQDYRVFLLENAYRVKWKTNFLARGATALVAALLARTVWQLRPVSVIGVWVALTALLVVTQRLLLELQYRLETKEDRLRQFGREQTLQFEEKGIVIQAAGISGSYTLEWNRILRAARTQKAFYLYMTPRTAAILPCRRMTEEEQNQLGDILGEKISGRYRRF